MANKYELITELVDVTARWIASDREEWKVFEETGGRAAKIRIEFYPPLGYYRTWGIDPDRSGGDDYGKTGD